MEYDVYCVLLKLVVVYWLGVGKYSLCPLSCIYFIKTIIIFFLADILENLHIHFLFLLQVRQNQ